MDVNSITEESDNKTFEQCCDEVAKKYAYENWNYLVTQKELGKANDVYLTIHQLFKEAAELYRIEAYSELHNKIMVQWGKDFGSIHNDQQMDAYTVSGFIHSILRVGGN